MVTVVSRKMMLKSFRLVGDFHAEIPLREICISRHLLRGTSFTV
jgi:hypothetical protein